MHITPLQRFWRLLKPFKREIGNVYVYAIFNGLVSLSLPLGIQAIVNLIQGGQVSTAWIVLVCLVVLGIGAAGVLQIYQLRLTEFIQQRIFTHAAFEFAYRIPRIRMEALYPHYAPELMNRFFDILTVQKGLSKILIDFSTAALQVIFGLLLLSFYHPFFILFSLILIILVYVIFRFTAARGLSTSLVESKYKYKVAHWLEELARTASAFKLAGMTDLPLRKTDDMVKHYIEARESHFKVLVSQYSMMVVFKVLVATGLLALGGILVMQQVMNIGQFIAAEIIILLVMSSVEKLILILESLYDVLTGLEKIGQVTDLELESENGRVMREECGDKGIAIELRGVRFNYPGRKNDILRGINLKIEAGEKVMIYGESGSGKSTLMQVISGLYEVTDGIVTYNGLTKGNINIRTLRSETGDFLNQQELFQGTLIENLTMGRDIPFEKVKESVEIMGLTDFVTGHTLGYDQPLDLMGRKLSSSVVQKILLARSIAHEPKLLLIEHALEGINPEERKRIIDFITAPERVWTLAIVSNDLYLAKRVQKIVVLSEGIIIRQGSYSEMEGYIKE